MFSLMILAWPIFSQWPRSDDLTLSTCNREKASFLTETQVTVLYFWKLPDLKSINLYWSRKNEIFHLQPVLHRSWFSCFSGKLRKFWSSNFIFIREKSFSFDIKQTHFMCIPTIAMHFQNKLHLTEAHLLNCSTSIFFSWTQVEDFGYEYFRNLDGDTQNQTQLIRHDLIT